MQAAVTSRVSGCNTVPCKYHSTLITQKGNRSAMFENFISALNSTIKHKKSSCALSQEELASLLKTNPEALRAFENSYESFTSTHPANSVFNKPARNEQSGTTPATDMTQLVERIVDELAANSAVYGYDDGMETITTFKPAETPVSLNEILTLPKDIRPDLTGNALKRDMAGTGEALAAVWQRYITAKTDAEAQTAYNSFRQGLDILDLDWITYKMIDTNPISMGYWLPKITSAVNRHGFFKIPSTKIVKLPMPLLQLTRLDYMSLSRTTLNIVDAYCRKVFGLEPDKEYFVKTGTYSSKFDFRNAHVHGKEEVRELGEYLLFIHSQAVRMADFDLSGKHRPVIYGVSTTTEWVVRDFIPDAENNTTIYHGLPLRTEYRVFVDFDTDTVLGIHPYWDANTVKTHFARNSEDPDMFHDLMTYSVNEEKLNSRYEAGKDTVVKHIEALLPDVPMHGQWSIDVMQNGNDFYIIDMATAEHSAYYDETVPTELRHVQPENWLPDLSDTETDRL